MSRGWPWLLAAWLVALTATLAALFLGEVLGMTPCLLCWYQRIMMFPLALILGMAAYVGDRRGAIYALPLALGGLAVASYHVALVDGWIPAWWLSCGSGPSCRDQPPLLFDTLSLPWLSWLAFAAVVGCLCTYLRRSRS